MTFGECVQECAKDNELVKEFNRLTGCKLGKSLARKPIEVMIDEACGRPGEAEDDMRTFIAFVFDCVWIRLPLEKLKVGHEAD